MNSIVIQAEALNLPEPIAIKLRGKKVELTENEGAIMIKPVGNAIESACGMLKSDGHAVDRFMKHKRLEKDFEYGA